MDLFNINTLWRGIFFKTVIAGDQIVLSVIDLGKGITKNLCLQYSLIISHIK